MTRRALGTSALVLATLALAQISLWWSLSRDRVFAAAFLHDLDLQEEYVRSKDFRGIPSGGTPEYLIICEEVAAQLSSDELSDASARYARLLTDFGVAPPKLITAAQWMGRSREEANRRWFQSGTRPHVGGICASGGASNPLYATVDCDDRVSELAQHGHGHIFVHLLGKWIPAWSGWYWES